MADKEFECVLESKKRWSWVLVFLVNAVLFVFCIERLYLGLPLMSAPWTTVDKANFAAFVVFGLIGLRFFRAFFRQILRAVRTEKHWVLRVDAKGLSASGELVVPWEDLRSVEIRRQSKRLTNSTVNFFGKDRKRLMFGLPLDEMTQEESEDCLAAIKKYVPDAEDSWQDQLKRRGLLRGYRGYIGGERPNSRSLSGKLKGRWRFARWGEL